MLLSARMPGGVQRKSSTGFWAFCVAQQQSTNVLTTQTHTPFNGPLSGTRKVKPIWIFLKQQTASGSGNSWDIRKSAPRSRQITMPAPHCSVFYRLDALPAAQPTVSKHWSKLYGTKKMILHIHKNNSFRVSKRHIWSKSWTHCHIMLGHMLKLSAA